jgi:hypothetical protein
MSMDDNPYNATQSAPKPKSRRLGKRLRPINDDFDYGIVFSALLMMLPLFYFLFYW